MMGDADHPRTVDANKRNYKVGRVLEEYDLGQLDANLVEMWLGVGSTGTYSLRELSEHINKSLLRTAMERAGIDPLDGETEETYRLLRGDGIHEAVRRKAIRRLSREEVDVEQLEHDFVTHQAVHSYLTKFRNARQHGYEQGESTASEELIDELSEQATRSIERLRDEERLSLGSFEIELELCVYCEDCGETYTVEELLEEGACRCDRVLPP